MRVLFRYHSVEDFEHTSMQFTWSYAFFLVIIAKNQSGKIWASSLQYPRKMVRRCKNAIFARPGCLSALLIDPKKGTRALFSASFWLPKTRSKGTKFFARKYLIIQNRIHFRQFHWPMDFGGIVWRIFIALVVAIWPGKKHRSNLFFYRELYNCEQALLKIFFILIFFFIFR